MIILSGVERILLHLEWPKGRSLRNYDLSAVMELYIKTTEEGVPGRGKQIVWSLSYAYPKAQRHIVCLRKRRLKARAKCSPEREKKKG